MGYRLDGNTDNYLDLPGERVFDVTSDPRPFAIAFWFRPANKGLGSYQNLFYNDNTGNEPRIGTYLLSGNLILYSHPNTVASASGSSVVNDKWNQGAVKWQADGVAKVFINGTLVLTTSPVAFTPGTATASSRKGRSAAGIFGYTGDVCEEAYWQGDVPSDAELESLWTGPEAGIRADALSVQPFRYHRFNGALTDEMGGASFSIVGTVNASSTIGSSPTHPNISSTPSGPSAAAGSLWSGLLDSGLLRG